MRWVVLGQFLEVVQSVLGREAFPRVYLPSYSLHAVVVDLI